MIFVHSATILVLLSTAGKMVQPSLEYVFDAEFPRNQDPLRLFWIQLFSDEGFSPLPYKRLKQLIDLIFLRETS